MIEDPLESASKQYTQHSSLYNWLECYCSRGFALRILIREYCKLDLIISSANGQRLGIKRTSTFLFSNSSSGLTMRLMEMGFIVS